MKKVAPVEEWLTARREEIPAPLLALLLDNVRDGRGEAVGFVSLAEGALARALQRPGRVRESAFLLLLGDAFLTYACEALARSPDPAGRLSALLEGLGERFR